MDFWDFFIEKYKVFMVCRKNFQILSNVIIYNFIKILFNNDQLKVVYKKIDNFSGMLKNVQECFLMKTVELDKLWTNFLE